MNEADPFPPNIQFQGGVNFHAAFFCGIVFLPFVFLPFVLPATLAMRPLANRRRRFLKVSRGAAELTENFKPTRRNGFSMQTVYLD